MSLVVLFFVIGGVVLWAALAVLACVFIHACRVTNDPMWRKQ